MKKFLLMFPILFIISCDQSSEIVIPKVGDDYKAQYHFSCNPIGWGRENIKDEEPINERRNYLFFDTYNMGDPPKWLQKKRITLDFERNYFNGYRDEDEDENELFNIRVIFDSDYVFKRIVNCLNKSPLGSCSSEEWEFDRITKQLQFESIRASDLKGEISLYNCVRADRVGEDYQFSQPK